MALACRLSAEEDQANLDCWLKVIIKTSSSLTSDVTGERSFMGLFWELFFWDIFMVISTYNLLVRLAL